MVRKQLQLLPIAINQSISPQCYANVQHTIACLRACLVDYVSGGSGREVVGRPEESLLITACICDQYGGLILFLLLPIKVTYTAYLIHNLHIYFLEVYYLVR